MELFRQRLFAPRNSCKAKRPQGQSQARRQRLLPDPGDRWGQGRLASRELHLGSQSGREWVFPTWGGQALDLGPQELLVLLLGLLLCKWSRLRSR